MKEQYCITQDSKALIEQLNFGTVPDEILTAYREKFVELLQPILRQRNIDVVAYKEQDIEQTLETLVEPYAEDPRVIFLCLDRFLLNSFAEKVADRWIRFSITRRKDNTKAPRQKAPPFEQQIQRIQETFPDLYERPIALIDDGIFTGNTILDVLDIWKQKGNRPLPVHTIVGFMGSGNTAIDGIPVQTVLTIEALYDWIDLRDFGPWGGKQLAASKNNRAATCIPYLYPWSMGEDASLSQVTEFFQISKQGIEQAIAVVKALEQSAQKTLTWKDVVRAGFALPTDYEKSIPITLNQSVTAYLESCIERITYEQQ